MHLRSRGGEFPNLSEQSYGPQYILTPTSSEQFETTQSGSLEENRQDKLPYDDPYLQSYLRSLLSRPPGSDDEYYSPATTSSPHHPNPTPSSPFHSYDGLCINPTLTLHSPSPYGLPYLTTGGTYTVPHTSSPSSQCYCYINLSDDGQGQGRLFATTATVADANAVIDAVTVSPTASPSILNENAHYQPRQILPSPPYANSQLPKSSGKTASLRNKGNRNKPYTLENMPPSSQGGRRKNNNQPLPLTPPAGPSQAGKPTRRTPNTPVLRAKKIDGVVRSTVDNVDEHPDWPKIFCGYRSPLGILCDERLEGTSLRRHKACHRDDEARTFLVFQKKLGIKAEDMALLAAEIVNYVGNKCQTNSSYLPNLGVIGGEPLQPIPEAVKKNLNKALEAVSGVPAMLRPPELDIFRAVAAHLAQYFAHFHFSCICNNYSDNPHAAIWMRDDLYSNINLHPNREKPHLLCGIWRKNTQIFPIFRMPPTSSR